MTGEVWEHDAAHLAVDQWINAWRSNNPGAHLPPIRFAQHLGREAVAMQNENVARTEMQRIFATYGYDAVCVCGIAPTEPIPEVTV